MAGKTKRIQLSPNIGVSDLLTKLKQAEKILSKKDQVQVWMIFKGRLRYTMLDVGMKTLENFAYGLFNGKPQGVPKLEGNTAKITIAPKK